MVTAFFIEADRYPLVIDYGVASTMDRKSEYKLKPDNEVEDLRRELSIENSPLSKNVGRRAIYHRSGVDPFEVVITGVQKVWDDDEEGNYRPDVEGYTVRRAKDEWIDDQTRVYPVYAASVREIEFLD